MGNPDNNYYEAACLINMLLGSKGNKMKSSTIILISLFSFLVVGCASSSGIVAVGEGLYLISKQAATGFPGVGGIKTEALNEATEFCQENGLQLQIESETESEPPYVLGNYPRVEIRFRCI